MRIYCRNNVTLYKCCEQTSKLAHDGEHGALVFLAGCAEALVAGLTGVFPADAGEGGHVEHAPRVGATATNRAAALHGSGVAVKGCQAEQGGGLAARDGA